MAVPPGTDDLYAGLSEAPLVVPLPLVMYQMRKAGQGTMVANAGGASTSGQQGQQAGAHADGPTPDRASEDLRMAQIVSFASQRFLATVLNDALQECKRLEFARAQLPVPKAKDGQPLTEPDRRRILTTQDLSHALEEYGVHLQPPPYYVDAKPR